MHLHGCVCMDTSVWIRLYVCVCMDTSAWIRLYGYVCMDTSVWIRLYGYVCMYASAWIRLHGYVCMGTSAWWFFHGCDSMDACARICLQKIFLLKYTRLHIHRYVCETAVIYSCVCFRFKMVVAVFLVFLSSMLLNFCGYSVMIAAVDLNSFLHTLCFLPLMM